MTTQELLQPFCALRDIRYYLNHIFKKGDFLCASDGRVLVRVPDDGTVEIHPETINNTIDIDKVLRREEWPQDGFIPLEFAYPDFIEKCVICNETGMTFEKEECDECDGDGEFKHGSHYYECKECYGEGELHANSGNKITCYTCNGTGVKYSYLTMPDGRMFNYQYLLKIKTLPNVTYLPDTNKDIHYSAPMRFKFDGGIGLLMPIRK